MMEGHIPNKQHGSIYLSLVIMHSTIIYCVKLLQSSMSSEPHTTAFIVLQKNKFWDLNTLVDIYYIEYQKFVKDITTCSTCMTTHMDTHGM